MKNKISFIASLIVMLVLASCGKKSAAIEGIPFKESEKGMWGMIAPDGEVIFKDEFKNEPTVVREGMFMVKNDNDLWEIYTADKKPKKVGSEYVNATLFSNGIALVAERNRPVTIINTEGKEIAVLDKIDGKAVTQVQRFHEGYAVYKTGQRYGVIDEKGKGVIAPKYLFIFNCSDGKFIALDEKYKSEIEKGNEKGLKYAVLDTKGKVLFELSGEKYVTLGEFEDGLLPVCVENEGERIWGLINEKQEVVVKPSEKFKGISQVRGDLFVYYNGDAYGVMNTKGESIIRAKYSSIHFDSDGTYLVANSGGDARRCKYIDKEDNTIGDDKYQVAFPYSWFGGKQAVVQESESSWIIIDRNGKGLEKLPDMVEVSFKEGDDVVESDCVDFAAMFEDLQLGVDGVDGVTFKDSPQQAVQKLSEYLSDTKPEEFEYRSSLYYTRKVVTDGAALRIKFDSSLSNEKYRTEREYLYTDYWGEPHYYERRVSDGYEWNNAKIKSFEVSFDHSHGKLRGKLRQLLKAFINHFSNAGKIVKQNNGAAVLSLNNGKVAVVYMTPDAVTLAWGEGNANSIDIEQFKDVKEAGIGENEGSYSQPDLDSSYYDGVDTCAADTTVCY